MIYMVECGFSDPALEDEWNAFYSGPKLASLLNDVPGFRLSQRFKDSVAGDAPYLAAHEVVSAELLTSPSYTGAGGGSFLQWQSHITNWRRTIFSGLDRLPEVKPDERLLVIDGEPREVEGVKFNWLRAAGLGNLVPTRGVAVVSAEVAEKARRSDGSVRVLTAISPQMRAAK